MSVIEKNIKSLTSAELIIELKHPKRYPKKIIINELFARLYNLGNKKSELSPLLDLIVSRLKRGEVEV